MLNILTISLIITGVVLLILGLCIKPLNKKLSFGNRKNKNTKYLLLILEKLTSIRIIQKPLDYLASNKTLWTNKLASKILDISEAGISLQQLYLLKMICLILCTLLVVIISYSNMVYKTKQIVVVSEQEQSILYQDNSYEESQYLLYKQIIAEVGRNKLSNADEAEKNYLVEKTISKYLNTADEKILDEKTRWFIKAWKKVQDLKVINYYHILIILLAMLIPEFLLCIRWLLRGCVYKKEIIKLEYIFELLARVDGIKTLDIILELEKSSKVYSKYLHEFSVMFQYDKNSGFNYLKGRNIKSLSKMANVLEIFSLSDKELALQVLEREAMERDEAIVITAEETIDFIDIVAFLSIVPLVYELARLMLNPMLDIVYRAFEFI